jgi:uncharacterized protein DUF4262
MCEMCDDPTLTKAEVLERMAWRVREYGWAIQGVEGDSQRPPWAYTVGLTLYGGPELLVTGIALQRAARLLNGMAARLLYGPDVVADTGEPQPGERLRVPGGPLVEYVMVEHPEVHLLTAIALFGSRVRGIQVVWADDRGRWPWEGDFRSRRGGQPVLGPRATR